MGFYIGKNISKNLNIEYSQELLDQAKQSATDTLITVSKRAIQNTAEATGDLIGNKITNRITKKKPPQNTSETVESETEIPKERHIYIYIYPEEKQQIIDELRLI